MMIPRTLDDADNDVGWTTYTAADYHSEVHYNSSSTSYGGGGRFQPGILVGRRQLQPRRDNRSHLNINTEDLEISFSYSAVDIKRPWLDTSLLNLKNWFLMGNYDKGCISDGTFGQDAPLTARSRRSCRRSSPA